MPVTFNYMYYKTNFQNGTFICYSLLFLTYREGMLLFLVENTWLPVFNIIWKAVPKLTPLNQLRKWYKYGIQFITVCMYTHVLTLSRNFRIPVCFVISWSFVSIWTLKRGKQNLVTNKSSQPNGTKLPHLQTCDLKRLTEYHSWGMGCYL